MLETARLNGDSDRFELGIVEREATPEPAMKHRWMASKIEADETTDWSELTDLEDEMWELTAKVSESIRSETEYSAARNDWWPFW